jgi:hypothetical protein
MAGRESGIKSQVTGILDRLGLGIQGRTPVKMQTATRQIGDVAIVDVSAAREVGFSELEQRNADATSRFVGKPEIPPFLIPWRLFPSDGQA